MKEFKGVMYSPATEIFYRWHKKRLYRFGTFKDSSNSSVIYKWVESDFKDMEGRSKYWVKATQEQIDDFCLLDEIKDIG